MLDRICGIKQVYTRNTDDTEWTGFVAPVKQVALPLCPSCQTPILSRRYGRLFKRAGLDELEKDLMVTVSQTLTSIQDSIRPIAQQGLRGENMVGWGAAARLIVKKSKWKSMQAARRQILKQAPAGDSIVISFPVSPSNVQLHHVRPALVIVWDNKTAGLNSLYTALGNLWSSRRTYTDIWKHAENATEIVDGTICNRDRLGYPFPAAHSRLLVETLWTMLDARLLMLPLAFDVLSEFSARNSPFEDIQSWAAYVSYLIETCEVDAKKAVRLSTKAELHRKAAHSSLYAQIVRIWKFRLDISMCRASGVLQDRAQRQILAETARTRTKEAREEFTEARKTFRLAVPINSMADDAVWIQTWLKLATGILGLWTEYPRSILENGGVGESFQHGFPLATSVTFGLCLFAMVSLAMLSFE